MTFIVKQLTRGKRGRTLQGCVMDKWTARRNLVNEVEAKERKLSA
jgi:hypothetical protein